MNHPLISIITATYNQSEFISEAISSVLNQTYTNWELIVINDGSTDDTKIKLQNFEDNRIKHYYQENKGVSAARNIGLNHMKGDYFCFLDADDVYTENSLMDRVNVFLKNENLSFVDGKVDFYSIDFSEKIKEYIPNFKGLVEPELAKLTGSCFMGTSWMIKKELNMDYKFIEGLTHGEDLLFYLSISKDKKYDFTSNTVLNYRMGNISAMSNLKGLEKGYVNIYKNIKEKHCNSYLQLIRLKLKVTKIMAFSYLKKGDYISAGLVTLKYLIML